MCVEIEKKAEFYGATIVDYDFPSSIRYVYHNGVIGINKSIVDVAERRCIIALGLGRHLMHNNKCIVYTEEQSNVVAMHWAVSILIPLGAFIEANRLGYCANEFADYLQITPEFLKSGIEFYKNIYGTRIMYQDSIIDLENRKIETLKKTCKIQVFYTVKIYVNHFTHIKFSKINISYLLKSSLHFKRLNTVKAKAYC